VDILACDGRRLSVVGGQWWLVVGASLVS